MFEWGDVLERRWLLVSNIAHGKQFIKWVCFTRDFTSSANILAMIIGEGRVLGRSDKTINKEIGPCPLGGVYSLVEKKNNYIQCNMCYNGESL